MHKPEKTIDYYEFPNGNIVKAVQSDAVYRYDPMEKVWQVDHSLTAIFAWDKPYGEPCVNLRQKADIACDLPPFPRAEEFYPGNTVFFGAYPQRWAHDFSPIPWLVLETNGDSALCITKDCLITSGYCDPKKAYTACHEPGFLRWERSLAREVCNGHFFDTAFSEAEKARILPRQEGGCTDCVFLLSEAEALEHFPQAQQRKAKPTKYAIQNGARLGWTEDTQEYTSWWLLPEEDAYGQQNGCIYPKAVFQMGEIQFHSRNVAHGDFTLRPCIRIRY